MKPAAEKLALELNNVKFNQPKISVVQNVNAAIANDIASIKDGLVKQLYSPVLWTDSIKTLAAQDVSVIVECGPGKVLSGLNKRIHEAALIFNLNSQETLAALQEQLK
jgi:[acyl-carrier-protein] S-malonyltransferase